MAFTQRGSTYFDRPIDEARDLLEVEVGDALQSDFFPQCKLKRWDNSANLSIRAQGNGSVIGDAGGKIRWESPDYQVHQYAKPELPNGGGFEFEWVLMANPPGNQNFMLRATIQSKNLDFFQQPDGATSGVDADGPWSRPENVVSSIAVYHKTQGGLVDAAGMNYRSGKFGHIYRPEAVDANGNRVWCELRIVGGELRVIVPRVFLNSATYPVVVDPTFGYTTAGGSPITVQQGSTSAIGNIVSTYTAASGDTITSFTLYIRKEVLAGDAVATLAAYTFVSSLPDARLASPQVTTPGYTNESTPAWVSTATVSQAMSAGSAYCIGSSAEGMGVFDTYRIYYDAGSPPGRINSTGTSLNDPFSPTGTDSGRHYSWYATYTAGSSATPKGPLSNPFAGPFGGAI